MKRTLYAFSLLGLVLLLPNWFGRLRTTTATEALALVTQQYHQDLAAFATQSQLLVQASQKFKQAPDSRQAQQLRAAITATRLAFKKVEFLLEYQDRHSVKRNLNGPPLPSLLPNTPKIVVLEPKGLQVLDELIFSDELVAEAQQVDSLAQELHLDVVQVQNFQTKTILQHRFIFEAARQEIVRILTLGLTGFDTPGSANAIPEAAQALAGVAQAIDPYLKLADKSSTVKVAKFLATLLTEAQQYLKQHPDFASFDRLGFLKTYLNPIFQEIHHLQKALGIETEDQTTPLPLPQNPQAKNIFANDFLNINYFANLGTATLQPQRVELGRLLFFDPVLSSNNQRACASCHQPEKGFTDGRPKSLASDGQGELLRNSPTLINAVFSERFFYDLREEELDRQIRHVVQDHREFNTTLIALEEKLQESADYRRLFAAAYPEMGARAISNWTIANALTNYISSLTSFNSPFDRYVRGETATLPPAAARGFNLFMGKAVCGTCHFAPTFSGLVPPFFVENESEVLGIPQKKATRNALLDEDLGRIASGRPTDEAYFYAYSFKTTTVRNVALTAPYMHNGVYQTLEEVVDFYNRGGGKGIGIHLEHQTLPFDELKLSQREQKDLVAFMQTLTDTTGMTARPRQLPVFEQHPAWNQRKIGGAY